MAAATPSKSSSNSSNLQPSYVDPAELPQLCATLRQSFDAGRTRSLAWRRDQLRALARLVDQCEAEICAALYEDLGKPTLEAALAEVLVVRKEALAAADSLEDWTAPEKVPTPVFAQPGRSTIQREPLGLVLIIGAWNYPFHLTMLPLIGAIAAGNCAIVKPSEVAPATSALLARLLPRYLDPDCIRVVEGAVDETTALLRERFDHIFYTGNGTVGRIVMRAAAEHLTPVTLELGGKSPCIVDERVKLTTAARRIAWGKFWNAGQTCVAPDYVLVHERIHDALVDALRATLREFYGDDPRQSPDYSRIVNARHHQRLVRLLDRRSGTVAVGGQHDVDDRYIAPTILTEVPSDAPVMADEIFGPILPVLKISGADEAVAFVNARPKPLALYVFSSEAAFCDTILERTSSGGASVNHVWMHLANPHLPFGGVGESGMGAYHGRSSFECFSHHRSVLRKPFLLDPPLAYPPYTEAKKAWLERLF